jgi:hypothetical protein
MEEVCSWQDYEVTVAGSFAETEPLREHWESLLAGEESPAFDSDPDQYRAVVESQADAHPHVFLLSRRNEPIAMVLGRIQSVRLPCSIGYKSFLLPPLKCLDIKPGWCFGQITEETATVLLNQIQAMLRSSQAEVVRFQGLHTDSPIYKAVLARTRIFRCACHGRAEPRRVLRVPASIEDYYKSRSPERRRNLHRCLRKIDAQYGPGVVVATYHDEANVDEFGRLAEQISAKTYQRALGAGFAYDERTRSLMRRLAARGRLRAYVLFLDGQPCAFEYGILHRGTCLLEQIGFDPAWKNLGVGVYLFIRVIEELCRPDSAVKIIDFGPGDVAYKVHYSTDGWQEATAFVFAPRLYPALINLLRTSITELNIAVRWIADRIGVKDWLRHLWRQRAEAGCSRESVNLSSILLRDKTPDRRNRGGLDRA